ncbi:MAG: hypothetical protein IPH45_15070 [Bacteroidales bacterium]|nr:hypothetical protein [Bacteroidales bacterium]
MKAKTILLVLFALLASSNVFTQSFDFDYKQTPYLYLNLKILDTKFGGRYNGFGLGVEPVMNLHKRLRVSACYDFPYLDGKYKTMNTHRNNDNELKKFYKLGLGAEFALINWTDLSSESVTIKEENIGWGWFRRHYVPVMVEYSKQITMRGGFENYRYILELNKYNAEMKDESPFIKIDNQRLSEYDAVANWKLNTFYAGLAFTRLYSSFVDVKRGKARFNEYLTWYADFVLPLSSNIETLKLSGSEYDLNPYVKKSDWGLRVGAMRITEGFVKIEAGFQPGVKAGYYIDMSLGFPLKIAKRR